MEPERKKGRGGWKGGPQESSRRYYRLHKDRILLVNRERELIKRYGLTLKEYEKICEEQGHKCAICGKQKQELRHQRLNVDHDHSTGAVRGLLCNVCNRAIGLLRDDAGLLRAAADYLEDNCANNDFGRQPAANNWIWSSEFQSGQEATV